MDKKKILRLVKTEKIKFLQFWFSDIHGNLKRVTQPIDLLNTALEDGVWFDGSSIEGFVRRRESDTRLISNPETFQIIPWSPKERKTARVFCDVIRADGQFFEGDPRYILKQAMGKARKLGFIYNTGSEVEFYLLTNEGLLIDQAGYFDATGDLGEGFRQQVLLYLKEMGIAGETGHHEVGPSQHEINIRYADVLTTADNIITLKHVIQRNAQHQNLKSTFIPKLYIDQAGSGMHIHQSLFDLRKRNIFHDPTRPLFLSETACHFIAGQLYHARALAAIVAPTVNSYKRLVSGYEAPVHICWGGIDRDALIRIPQITPGREKSTRCEFRCPDPSCNPYLACAVMLAAGLDGIEKKIELKGFTAEYFDDEKFNLLPQLPRSLNEALDELERDQILLEVLGLYTSVKFLEAKRKEWTAYCQKESEEDRQNKITNWELEHCL